MDFKTDIVCTVVVNQVLVHQYPMHFVIFVILDSFSAVSVLNYFVAFLIISCLSYLI